jgi:hypothetical protein
VTYNSRLQLTLAGARAAEPQGRYVAKGPMKYILSFLIALLSGDYAHAELPVGSEYVSIDCPKGDITLMLNKDGKFSLELKHWDPKQNRHTRSETLVGSWSLSGKKLVLSGSAQVTYERAPSAMTVGSYSANIDGFKWRHSSKPTFADTFSLMERKATDDLLLRAAPK